MRTLRPLWCDTILFHNSQSFPYLIKVPLDTVGTSIHNAKVIRKYVLRQTKPVIIIGHSKVIRVQGPAQETLASSSSQEIFFSRISWNIFFRLHIFHQPFREVWMRAWLWVYMKMWDGECAGFWLSNHRLADLQSRLTSVKSKGETEGKRRRECVKSENMRQGPRIMCIGWWFIFTANPPQCFLQVLLSPSSSWYIDLFYSPLSFFLSLFLSPGALQAIMGDPKVRSIT